MMNQQHKAFGLAVAMLVIATVDADEECTSDTDWTFVPLLIYFIATVLFGCTIMALKHCDCRCSTPDEKPTRQRRREMPRASTLLTLATIPAADEEAAPRESWQLRLSELKFGKKVGVGNVGVVYSGRYRGDRVAIKRLLGNWYKHEDMVARFREEIMLMSQLDHPNVLRFVGAVMDPEAGNVCLVTELCKQNLHELLHSTTKLDWHSRIAIAVDIARGMRYLHFHAGIIQRDLKSANILVDFHQRVKIADFGLSRRSEPGRMETYCGTPATMAPEIVRQENYTEKADVFSFGIILWEILTRQEPYKGRTGMGLAFAVANENLRPWVPEYCPQEYATLMKLAWHKDPVQRPSFSDLVHSLLMLQKCLNESLRTDNLRGSGSLPRAARHLAQREFTTPTALESLPWNAASDEAKPSPRSLRVPTSLRNLSSRLSTLKEGKSSSPSPSPMPSPPPHLEAMCDGPIRFRQQYGYSVEDLATKYAFNTFDEFDAPYVAIPMGCIEPDDASVASFPRTPRRSPSSRSLGWGTNGSPTSDMPRAGAGAGSGEAPTSPAAPTAVEAGADALPAPVAAPGVAMPTTPRTKLQQATPATPGTPSGVSSEMLGIGTPFAAGGSFIMVPVPADGPPGPPPPPPPEPLRERTYSEQKLDSGSMVLEINDPADLFKPSSGASGTSSTASGAGSTLSLPPRVSPRTTGNAGSTASIPPRMSPSGSTGGSVVMPAPPSPAEEIDDAPGSQLLEPK